MNIQTIPVIDINRLDDPKTLAALDAACCNWGFFQVVNHGVEDSVIASLRREMREFFARPQAVKRETLRSEDNPWGFYDRELTKNTLDWKEVYDYGPAESNVIRPQWPRAMPTFKHAVHAYYDANEALAFRLLSAVSKNLGMTAEY